MSSEFKTVTNFSSNDFRIQFPDFIDYSDKECEEHYIIYGTLENPTGLPKNFTVDSYKSLWNDLECLSNKEIITHFLTKGISEERIYWIPPDFDCEEYKRLNPELQELSEFALKEHYIKQGINLNRTYKLELPEDFNVSDYRKYNADLSQLSDLQLMQHYSVVGKQNTKRVYKVSLPLDFDFEIYRHFNKDLLSLSPEKLEVHYSLYGKKEGRKYADPLFDLDFFVSFNKISYYVDYTTYTNDITQIKSLELYNKVSGLSAHQTNGILLVNSSSEADTSSEFIYNLANQIKKLTTQKVYIIEKTINEERLSNYGLSKDDVISYEEDSTLLYYICKVLTPSKILFGSVNSQILDVYFLIKNNYNVKLLSTKNKWEMDRLAENIVPDYVFSQTHKEQYNSKKIKVISPVVSINSINLPEGGSVTLENSKQKLNTKHITIGTHGDFSHKQTYLTFARLARAFPKYNFVWIGGKATERPEQMKDLRNLFYVEEQTFTFNLYKLFDYFILLTPENRSFYSVLENLYLGNKVITFKTKDSISYTDPLLNNIYFEYEGYSTLENSIEAIKQFVKENTTKTKHLEGKQYVTERFIDCDRSFLIDLLVPANSSRETRNKTNRELNVVNDSSLSLKILPLDFDAAEYAFLNEDLQSLSVEELEMHYRTEGFVENRIYKDFLFDREFCQTSYANYLTNVSIYKSQEIVSILNNNIPGFSCKKESDVILIENSSYITNESHSLYSLYNLLTNKYGMSVLLATPEINIKKLSQYNIQEYNVWEYKNDPTLLYHFCSFIKPKQIWQIYPNKILNHIVNQLPNTIKIKTINTNFLEISFDSSNNTKVYNNRGSIDLNKITIGSGGLIDNKHYEEIFVSMAKLYSNYNFVWFGDNKILSKEHIANLYQVHDSQFSTDLYNMLDYYIVLSDSTNSHSDILFNLYLGNPVIVYENSLATKFDNREISQLFAVLKGHITELGVMNAIKIICTSKFAKLSDVGKYYVENLIQKEESLVKTFLHENIR